MSMSIDAAFIKQFEAEVHVAYQRMGSKLRNTVRTVNGVTGATTTFQKVGKGTASQKTRHGTVPVMNADHTPVECTLYDYYAGDWVDRLDLLKTNINEQQIISRTAAYALGRKTDELLMTAAATTTSEIGNGSAAISKTMALELLETMGENDVPEDGRRYVFVGWRQWTQLLQIPEFSDLDYVGPDMLPWNGGGAQGKMWLGMLWQPHSGLPLVSTERTCIAYHQTALGHAIAADVQTDITWHGDRAAHFVNSMMSQGACLIDATGCFKLRCLES